MRIIHLLLSTALVGLASPSMSQAPAQTVAAKSSAPAGAHAVPKSDARPKKAGTSAHAPMDLHAPPLSHIYPSSELRYILAPDESSTDTPAEVSVKSDRAVVRVPGGPGNQLQAIPWAIFHP